MELIAAAQINVNFNEFQLNHNRMTSLPWTLEKNNKKKTQKGGTKNRGYSSLFDGDLICTSSNWAEKQSASYENAENFTEKKNGHSDKKKYWEWWWHLGALHFTRYILDCWPTKGVYTDSQFPLDNQMSANTVHIVSYCISYLFFNSNNTDM